MLVGGLFRKDNNTVPRRVRLSRRGIPTFAALLFVTGVLLIFNFSTSNLLREFEASREKELAERMRLAARTIVRELKSPRPPFILLAIRDLPTADDEERALADFAETTAYDDLLKTVRDQQSFFGVSQIVLFSPRQNVVADSQARTEPGDPFVFGDIDKELISQALLGGVAVSELYFPRADDPQKRLYLRLAENGVALGVLQISVIPDFVEEMQAQRRRVRGQLILSSILFVVVGVMMQRLFRYTLQAENRALQAARVEAMGALAGGVAHELRNPLSIIRILSEEIQTETAKDSQSYQNATDIIHEVSRLNEMVTQFLALSRAPDVMVEKPVNIVEEISKVVSLMERGPAKATILIENRQQGPVFVLVHQHALRQLFLNLILNACEALPSGPGVVRIIVQVRRGMVEVQIADEGAGISPKDLLRVTEPFYTTKNTGTGLGLSISKTIVETAGGSLTIASQVGRGTVVTVTLPQSVDGLLMDSGRVSLNG